MLTIVGTAASDFLGFRQVPPNGMWFKCPLLVFCKVLGGNRCYLSLLACSFDDAPSLNSEDNGGNKRPDRKNQRS